MHNMHIIIPLLSMEASVFHPIWVRIFYQGNNAYLIIGSDVVDPVFTYTLMI